MTNKYIFFKKKKRKRNLTLEKNRGKQYAVPFIPKYPNQLMLNDAWN